MVHLGTRHKTICKQKTHGVLLEPLNKGGRAGSGKIHLRIMLRRDPRHGCTIRVPIFEETWASIKEVASLATKGKEFLESKRKKRSLYLHVCITSAWKQCDDKKAYKHTGHPLPHSYTQPHSAPCSQFHHRYVAKLLHCHRTYLGGLGGVHRPYNALHLLTCPRDRALQRACIALETCRVVQQRVP